MKHYKSMVHPGGLTWNLLINHLESMIFQTSMIMFHVNLPGCKFEEFSLLIVHCLGWFFLMTPEIFPKTPFFFEKSWMSAEGSLFVFSKRVLYQVGFWKKHQQQLRVFGNSSMNQSRTNEMSENAN